MQDLVKNSLLKWLTRITSATVTYERLFDGELLLELIRLSGDTTFGSGSTSIIEKVETFLEINFRSDSSPIFNVKEILSRREPEIEILGLYLTVLLGCLQSPFKERFMNAALSMDVQTQEVIFYIIKDPMTQLSLNCSFSRDMLLKKIAAISMNVDATLPKMSDKEDEPQRNCLKTHAIADTDEINEFTDNVVPSNSINSKLPLSDSEASVTQPNYAVSSNGHIPLHCVADLTILSTANHSVSSMGSLNKRRPLHLQLDLVAGGPQSQAATVSHDSEYNGNHKLLAHPPLTSPLTTLKALVDSPSWTYKTQLRELEREKRRLLMELDKERAYRDEVESVVVGLRQQNDEALVRTTEAESRASKLSRELDALNDQSDELHECRAELAVKEDEIDSLKQRLNGFQDLLAHARKLEIENSDLRHECADCQQKISEMSSKLKEIKDRRMMCSEVEQLRSKLRNVEIQLAQEIRERETVEQYTRKQNELLKHWKLQQTLDEKRRVLTNNACNLINDHSADIECIDESAQNCDQMLKDGPQSTDSLNCGENLGSVLESELKSARLRISRLENDLHTKNEKLLSCESEIDRLTNKLTDCANVPAQYESTDESQYNVDELNAEVQTLTTRLECLKQSQFDYVNDDDDDNDVVEMDKWKYFDVGYSLLQQFQEDSANLSEPISHVCDAFILYIKQLMHNFQRMQEDLNTDLKNKHTDFVQQTHLLTTNREQQLNQCNLLLKQSENELQKASSRQKELQLQFDEIEKELDLTKQQFDELLLEKNNLLASKQTLQVRFNEELETARQLLEDKTVRLCQLEDLVDGMKHTPLQVDCAVQANLDDTSDLKSPVKDRTFEVDPYTASADDRRGLSVEVIRLHEKLASSTKYTRKLEKELLSLRNKLCELDKDLGRERTLANRAQQNWILNERALREANDELISLREQLDSYRNSPHQTGNSRADTFLSPTSTDVIRNGKDGDQNYLKQLLELTFELKQSCEDRQRLLQRNKDLQRELETIQSLIQSLPHRNHKVDTPCNRRNSAKPTYPHSNGYLDDSFEDWSLNEDSCSVVCSSARTSRPSISPKSSSRENQHRDINLPSNNGNVNNHHKHRKKRIQKQESTDVEELLRLTSRTAALEAFAMKLHDNLNQHCNQINQKTEIHDPGLDTDADSSAFTDLSQVSLAPAHMSTHKPMLNVNITTANSKSKPDQLSPILQDPQRIAELHIRNRLQPPHLRSSYPVETQVVNSGQVVDALGSITTNKLIKDHFQQNKVGQLNSHTESDGCRPLEENTLCNPMRTNLLTDAVMPAGYHPLPKDIQSITEALIAASDDPTSMMVALSSQLSQLSSVTLPNLVSVTSSAQQHTRSSLPNHTGHQTQYLRSELRSSSIPNNVPTNHVFSSEDLSESKPTRNDNNHVMSDDENLLPPVFINSIPHHKPHDFAFAKPYPPVTRSYLNKSHLTQENVNPGLQARKNSPSNILNGDDDIIEVCSVRSNGTSFAFDIPMGNATNKRVPPTRFSGTRPTGASKKK